MATHTTDDLLVSFLYELMRDHVTPGKVAHVLQETLKAGPPHTLSNGHLAKYAEEVVASLRSL